MNENDVQDREVLDYVRNRMAADMPPEFTRDVMNDVHRTTQRRRGFAWPIFTGLAMLVVWLGCFGVWAGVAPLNSAVVTSGTFVATGQNKLVQHLEGGIIREIAVKDGDAVEANQVLVRMDDTAANSKLRRLVLKKYRLLAMKARLEAEMSSSETIETPAAFSASARDPEIKAILERQRAELRGQDDRDDEHRAADHLVATAPAGRERLDAGREASTAGAAAAGVGSPESATKAVAISGRDADSSRTWRWIAG